MRKLVNIIITVILLAAVIMAADEGFDREDQIRHNQIQQYKQLEWELRNK